MAASVPDDTHARARAATARATIRPPTGAKRLTSPAGLESCEVCHGTDAEFSVEVMHKVR
jgi:hypothetical protein